MSVTHLKVQAPSYPSPPPLPAFPHVASSTYKLVS